MALIIGMNSGSSFDGIDVILAETEIANDGFPKPTKFLKGNSYAWPKEVEDMIMPAFDNKVDMVGMTRLTYIAGAVMAESVRKFMKENKIDPKDIEVLGVDGQTIYQEQPEHIKIAAMTDEQKDDWVSRWLDGPYPVGYQIGDTSVIAGLTNITTVTNFRQGDHVWGGSAAPLMQYFDFVLFRDREEPTLTLNIGGIANVHLAYKDRKKMVAFDTGPGNLLSDHAARILVGQPCDYDGKIAAAGKVNKEMLDEFMDHDFFKRPVPRSGWKYDFSKEYTEKMLKKYANLSKEDIMATICAFTAEAIVKNMNDYIPQDMLQKVKVMYASGGGVKNPTIMKYIQERLPQNIRLASSDEIGIPPEYKEACKFATLAYSTMHNIANNIPAACHASQYTIMGKVSFAPWKAKCVEPLE
ncbi:anhydro-N-acetylmuramic acid kinase [Christensenellaceae bacterium]|nr:anhydro-N-acetylmuramic acid kinase [Christensenellaceae bacterium]BDF60193.1 anhydro-N-acetylmuramic acid kinase [Christensenellaceae bacterium]